MAWARNGEVTGPRRVLAMTLLIAGLTMTACDSPEATRTRNGGPGGDIGNRERVTQMHGELDPYRETPMVGTAVGK